MKMVEQVGARGEQPQQDASRRRMLLEQREERRPRADRRDELRQVHQRQIRIGQPADLVDHHRAEAFEQLATARTGRCMRRSAREQLEMARAFVGAGKVEFAQIAGRGIGIQRRVPRQFRGGGNPARRLFFATGQRLAELQLDQRPMRFQLPAEFL